MIRYDHKDALQCWPDGEYAASLKDAEETVSRSGNPMYKLTIEAYRDERKCLLFDYAVIPDMLWKIKKLARAIGHLSTFEANKFDPSEFIGVNFRVVLDIEDNVKYGEQNRIRDYLPKTQGAADQAKQAKANEPSMFDEKDDDLPF